MILLFLLFGMISAARLPDGVKLCHRSDPNFQKCVATNIGPSLKYFANGYRELGVPALEPLFIEKLEIDGESKGSVSLSQKYTNVNIFGITTTSFEKYFNISQLLFKPSGLKNDRHRSNQVIELDNGCRWDVDAVTPVAVMNADYEVKGQLLVFPINSHGKCNITQYNMVNRQSMTCEKYTKKNETYIRVLNYTMDIRPEKIVYDFDNVFPENKQIADEIAKTLNENSLSIYNDVKGGIEKALGIIYKQYMENVFSRLPLNQIFLD